MQSYKSSKRALVNIKAAVARTHGAPLTLEGLVLDAPRDDEIVVRLVAAGVSQVDRAAIAGTLAMPLPFVPGSEGGGIVEHIGAGVTGLAAGDAVLVGYAFCGVCVRCRASCPRACLDFAALNLSGRRADGSSPFTTADAVGASPRPVNGFFFGQSSFATHLLCRADCVIKMPVEAPLEILAGLGGELLVGAAVITEAFDLIEGDSIVITGANAVGLVACMMAKASGATTIVVADPDAARRALAIECGATIAVHTDDDLAAVVRSLEADGFHCTLDTTGEAAAARACLDSLSVGGICVLLQSGETDIGLTALAGQTLLHASDVEADPGSIIPMLAALHADGRLPVEKLIGFFPFERVNDALDELAAGTVVKPVLRFPLGPFGDLDRALTEGATRDAPASEEPADPVADMPETQSAVPVEA